MEKETLFSTKFLELCSIQRSKGGEWVYARRPNAKDIAVIVPVIKIEDEEHILFLITKRPPIESKLKDAFCLEFPAGLVGDINKDETIEEAIMRELKEESGYEAQEIKIVSRKIASSSGLTDETSTIAIAKIDGSKKAQPTDDDGGVIVAKKIVKKNEVINFIKQFEKDGNVLGGQTLSGLLFYFFDK